MEEEKKREHSERIDAVCGVCTCAVRKDGRAEEREEG